jgi:hypothetical protein
LLGPLVRLLGALRAHQLRVWPGVRQAALLVQRVRLLAG